MRHHLGARPSDQLSLSTILDKDVRHARRPGAPATGARAALCHAAATVLRTTGRPHRKERKSVLTSRGMEDQGRWEWTNLHCREPRTGNPGERVRRQ